MRPGTVIVDVAVDQGGCVETIKATTHNDPVYEVDGVIHYAVANMPGGVPRTSTLALTNATLPVRGPARQQGLEAVRAGTTPRSRSGSTSWMAASPMPASRTPSTWSVTTSTASSWRPQQA